MLHKSSNTAITEDFRTVILNEARWWMKRGLHERVKRSTEACILGSSQERQRERAVSSSRPLSMIQTYHPSMMDVSQDTLPELQPIFTFLNSHANKLYQEGYFLKLDDQNTRMQSYCQRSVFLTRGRRKTKRRPDMDRMLCPACGDSIVTVVSRKNASC